MHFNVRLLFSYSVCLVGACATNVQNSPVMHSVQSVASHGPSVSSQRTNSQPPLTQPTSIASQSAEPNELVDLPAGKKVRDFIHDTGCSTEVVRGLSVQLVKELQCMHPNALVLIAEHEKLHYDGAVMPYLQAKAATAFKQVVEVSPEIVQLRSAFRTLPQQVLLFEWYKARRCGISLAAKPGLSNHESGLAIDIANAGRFRLRLERAGFVWMGASDRVHFDFSDADVDLKGLSIRAFQRLWSRANPMLKVTESGVLDEAWLSRLLDSPANGFKAKGACHSL